MSRESGGPPIDPELTALEGALGGLVPAASRISRDQLMFRAGAASVAAAGRARSPFRPWPVLAASLAVLALGEGVLLARRPVVERVVVVRAPLPPAVASAVVADSAPDARPAPPPGPAIGPPRTPAGRLEWQLARYGLDALPATPPPVAWGAGASGEAPPSALRLRETLLRELEPGGPKS
jgi:hypothetical protein